MSNVIVVIAGRIDRPGNRAADQRWQAHPLADLRQENAAAGAEVLSNAGFEVSTATIDVSSRAMRHTLHRRAVARES